MTLRLRTFSVCFLGICLVLSGCRRQPVSNGLTPVRLQTDWYPQPEHGGFYDAQIRGYYKDEGLDVTILPGGPYVNTAQLVSAGTVQFAMGSSDNTLESIGNGVPLVAVAATMQHDPQAIMVHQNSPVHSFQDLDGHAVAIRLGASTWFEYLVKRYQLRNVREIPATYSVANFLQDPAYIQQIFVTSEPFFARQAGAQVRTLLISQAGYDPYRVFLTSRSYLQEHPEIVTKFVRASLRGWRDYLVHPDDINAAIGKLNPAMSVAQMKFSYEGLRDQHFIAGDAADGADLGRFDPARWTSMYQQLLDLKVITKPFDPATAYTMRFMPNGN
ncbi:MAG: NitT/TauT family transport system substrate-binding protein [Acidobacteriaceae bacterium]|jgi:NitT/TauT family transport system substrate-binding protein|nr:NitT/TauT family transport system substrate-binding protein [Acidobacteriaceae bacterium]